MNETSSKSLKYFHKFFDEFAKICTNSYCRKEFRSEECYHLKDICLCGAALKLKIESEAETIKMVNDKKKSFYVLKFLRDYVLNEVKNLEFPLKNTLTAYKTMIENENQKNEKVEEEISEQDSEIDERYGQMNDFKLKYIKIDKNFLRIDKKKLVLKKDQSRFADGLKNVSKPVRDLFRKNDLKESYLKYIKYNPIKEKIDKLNSNKDIIRGMSEEKFREFYRNKMSKYIYLQK